MRGLHTTNFRPGARPQQTPSQATLFRRHSGQRAWFRHQTYLDSKSDAVGEWGGSQVLQARFQDPVKMPQCSQGPGPGTQWELYKH